MRVRWIYSDEPSRLISRPGLTVGGKDAWECHSFAASRGRALSRRNHGSHQSSQKHQSQGSQTQCSEDQCKALCGGQEPSQNSRNLGRYRAAELKALPGNCTLSLLSFDLLTPMRLELGKRFGLELFANDG